MGHPKSPNDFGSHLLGDSLPSADDTFIWTYTSPEFPMAQVCSFTTFCISCFSLLFFLGVWGFLGGEGVFLVERIVRDMGCQFDYNR